MIPAKTKDGFEIELSEDALDDAELLDALGGMQDGNVFDMSHLTLRLLGKEGRKKLYDHLRTPDGRVPVAKVADALGVPGKIGVVKPTFEEYPNRKNAEDVIAFLPSNGDYSYSAEDLMNYYADKDIKTLLLINPDNPSGNYIPKKDVLLLAAWAEEREICLIVDESFVDFADETDSSLLEQAVLTQYPHLFVMKSISKSYGVPGIRLGILAGDNKEMIAKLKKDVSIWNINSFGEFYLQIYEKYAKDYKAAMDKFRQERRAFVNALAEVQGLRVIPSQANYLLCELTNGESATKLAEDLLDEDNILIKDLSTKKGFEGRNYIRIAIRDEKDNEKLVAALKKKLN